MRNLATVALAFALCGAASAGAAEPPAQYSSDEFVRAILSGPLPCPKGVSQQTCEANPKTRRFSLGTPTETSAAKRPVHVIAPARPPKVTSQDVLVTFAVGSAEITPQGQANLRSVAIGLNQPALAEVAFEVAGFTDVTGRPETNLVLSQQRAQAVKTYLVSQKVAAARLNTAGYGSEHLADPSDPASEANRRVELHRQN
jgi:outer membrane protein OmpA-like peptidoglycan-associated protein